MSQQKAKTRPLKWPEKLQGLKIGHSVDVEEWEEVAARMAKTRLEKVSKLRFTVRKDIFSGQLKAWRLDDEVEQSETQAA